MAAQYAASVFDVKDEPELGEKVNHFVKLNSAGFLIPPTFIIKPQAFVEFINSNKLGKKISHLLGTVDLEKAKSVRDTAAFIKKHMAESKIPTIILNEILKEYKKISGILHHDEVNIYLSDHQKDFPIQTVRGDSSLLEAIKSMWVNLYPVLPNANPALIVQKILKGKSGKIKTTTKLIKSFYDLSVKDKAGLEDLVEKFKKEFYLPHEIDWVIDSDKVHILKIRPEISMEMDKNPFAETHYVITRNSHHTI